MKKIILTVAPAGNIVGKKENPAVPYSPEEIAESVYECWQEGAAIAHIHCRDERGRPTNDPLVYRRVYEKVRDKRCNIILDFSTTGPTIDEGMKALEADPEIGTLTMGPSIILSDGMARVLPRDQFWLESQARMMASKNIKPNLEVFNMPMLESVNNLREKGLLDKPCWVGFIMGTNKWNQMGTNYSLKIFLNYIEHLPPESIYYAIVQGEQHLQGMIQSILLGGHVRSGFEDTIFLRGGELAKGNFQLIGRLVRIARELGREPASANETREILKIEKII